MTPYCQIQLMHHDIWSNMLSRWPVNVNVRFLVNVTKQIRDLELSELALFEDAVCRITYYIAVQI